MAEPDARTTMEFVISPDAPPGLDHAYADRERRIRWEVALHDPDINPAAESGPAGGTPEQVAAIPGQAPPGQAGPPEPPGRAPTGEKVSPLTVAVQTAAAAAGAAAKAAMQGMTTALVPAVAPGGQAEAEIAKAGTRGPVMQAVAEVGAGVVDKVAGVRQVMMDGLLGLGMAPLIGAGAGVRQAFENAGIADVTVADPINASFIRMVTSGVNPHDPHLSDEQRNALWSPMTLGEFAEIATQTAPLWVPAATAAGRVTARRVKQGLMSTDPEGGRLTTFGMFFDPTKPPATSAAPAVGALNVARISAPEAVKAVMLRLHELAGAGERLQAHRARVSHEATIAAGKAQGINLNTLMQADLETYLPSAPEQEALRNMFNAVGHVSTHLEARIAAGDVAVQAEYIQTQAIGLVLAALDEAGARNVARSQEARKILSDAERAHLRSLADFARRLGVETGATPEVAAGKALVERAKATGEKIAAQLEPAAAPAGDTAPPGPTTPKPAALNVADLVAQKIGGELTLTTVAAELIRTAHGGTMPETIAPAELVAAKMTAELQAQQPHIGPDALRQTYKAIQRAQEAGADAQVRAYDQAAVTIANYLAASGYVKPPTAMTLVDAVARKMTLDLMALPQAQAGVSPEALLVTMKAYLETEHQRRTFYGNWWAGMQAGASIVYGAWVQGLISGIKTSARNLSGMAVSFPYEAPVRFTAEWVNKFVTKDPDGVQRGETAHALSRSVDAITAGIRLMGEAWKENKAPWEEEARKRSKVSIFVSEKGKDLNTGKAGRMDHSAMAYGFDPDTTFGAFLDTANKVLNSRWTPGGALIVEDAFAKGVSYELEIGALAARNATREGHVQGTPAWRARVKELETRPTPQMVVDAQDHAILITMNRELGATGQLAMKLMDRIPGARVLVPFVRWGTNAAKFAVQHTAILGEMSAQNWRDINPMGGNWGTAGAEAAARDKAIARMVVGVGTTGAIVAAVLNGSITPQRMLTPVQRALRPFREEGSDDALKVGNTWVSGYSQWGGQVGLMVSAIANYVDLLRYVPSQKMLDQWVAGLETISIASGFTFIRQSSMQGLGTMFDAIQDPERSAAKQLKGLARSAVPTLVRDLAKATDDSVMHEVHGVIDAFKSGLPYFNQGIAAHRHPVTGEVQQYPAAMAPEFLWPFGAFVNMVSPITFTAQQDRPWAKEIVKNQVLLRPIGDYVSLHGFTTTAPPDLGPQITEKGETGTVELTAAQKDNAIVYMTQQAKDGHGRTLPEALDALVQSDEYQHKWSTGPQGGQATRLRATYQEFAARAHAWLLDPSHASEGSSPTLKAQLLDAQRAKDNQKRNVTDPKSPQFDPSRLLQTLGR